MSGNVSGPDMGSANVSHHELFWCNDSVPVSPSIIRLVGSKVSSVGNYIKKVCRAGI